MSPSHSCASDHATVEVSTTVNHGSLPPPRYEPVPTGDTRTPTDATDRPRDALLQSPTRRRADRDIPEMLPEDSGPSCPNMPRLPLPQTAPAQLALSAMQFLPVPLLVLSNLKTVVLANEAMGRLLGMMPEAAPAESLAADVDGLLLGQSLSQVGVDMAREGQPVWVDWEKFLDSLVTKMGDRKGTIPFHNGTDGTQTGHGTDAPPRKATHHTSRNAVVEVIISRKDLDRTSFDLEAHPHNSAFQICANMIVTVWELDENQIYFSLTFAIAESHHLSSPLTKVASATVIDAAKPISIPNSNPPTPDSSHDSNSTSYRLSPSSFFLASSPFLPLGTPSMSSISRAPSVLQKIIVMKDALLDSIQTPVLAMWKDGSVAFPNRGMPSRFPSLGLQILKLSYIAARRLFNKSIDLEKCIDGGQLVGLRHTVAY